MTDRLAPPRRLLVIEDDADNSHLLQTYFTAHHFTVEVAVRGPAGLELARQGQFDLIILDVNLPGLDGFGVLEALRAAPRTSQVPVIILTERAAQSDRLAGLSRGANDYVTKPYDLEELRLRAQAALNRAARDGLLDPRTGLPTGRLVDDHLRHAQSQPGWRVIDCRLEAFRPFVDLNGFAAGDEVMVFAGRLLREVVAAAGAPDDVIGHPAHDHFVILTTAADPAGLADLARARFNAEVQAHYSFLDVEQGYVLIRAGDGSETRAPLMTLTVSVR